MATEEKYQLAILVSKKTKKEFEILSLQEHKKKMVFGGEVFEIGIEIYKSEKVKDNTEE